MLVKMGKVPGKTEQSALGIQGWGMMKSEEAPTHDQLLSLQGFY